jgi:hypothetical protein
MFHFLLKLQNAQCPGFETPARGRAHRQPPSNQKLQTPTPALLPKTPLLRTTCNTRFLDNRLTQTYTKALRHNRLLHTPREQRNPSNYTHTDALPSVAATAERYRNRNTLTLTQPTTNLHTYAPPPSLRFPPPHN